MAGYIGSKAVSVNTTSATISDDLAVGDDLAVTGLATIGETLAVTGVVTANAGVVVDTMTLDAATLTATSDFTVDSGGDIILDVAGSDIKLKVAGTEFGQIYKESGGNLAIYSSISDKDIRFQGLDGSSVVTALTLDMSDAGAATLNNGLTLTDGNLVVASGHGIDFSATGHGITDTDSSELLDDYEEGAWTPAFVAGGTSISYNTQFGKYTKIGRIVTAEFWIQGTITGNAEQVQIQGLPYNLRNENFTRGAGPIGFQSLVSGSTPQLYGAQNGATFALYKDGDAAFVIADGTTVSSKYIIGVFIYPTDT
jgi:hypothetical protein